MIYLPSMIIKLIKNTLTEKKYKKKKKKEKKQRKNKKAVPQLFET